MAPGNYPPKHLINYGLLPHQDSANGLSQPGGAIGCLSKSRFKCCCVCHDYLAACAQTGTWALEAKASALPQAPGLCDIARLGAEVTPYLLAVLFRDVGPLHTPKF